MNLYLDIDGVLLTKEGKPSQGLDKFLLKTSQKHTLYWLTTHCRHGNKDDVLQHLKFKLPLKTYALVQDVKPTTWDVLKTDGIDFSKEFVWLDDYILESEKTVLKKHNHENNFILVNLKNNPNQLTEIAETL